MYGYPWEKTQYWRIVTPQAASHLTLTVKLSSRLTLRLGIPESRLLNVALNKISGELD